MATARWLRLKRRVQGRLNAGVPGSSVMPVTRSCHEPARLSVGALPRNGRARAWSRAARAAAPSVDGGGIAFGVRSLGRSGAREEAPMAVVRAEGPRGGFMIPVTEACARGLAHPEQDPM